MTELGTSDIETASDYSKYLQGLPISRDYRTARTARPNDIFILGTDASDIGIGGVLSQKQYGVEKVIADGSCMLTKAERNAGAAH